MKNTMTTPPSIRPGTPAHPALIAVYDDARRIAARIRAEGQRAQGTQQGKQGERKVA